jgi:general secretion pathway protein I
MRPGRSRSMRRRDEAGFTLLEVLVSMAVFSLAAVALVNLAGENTRAAGITEARTLAAIVADNRAVAAMTTAISAGETRGKETQGGRDWAWTQKVSAGPAPGILKVEISVRDGAQTLVGLEFLRAAP